MVNDEMVRFPAHEQLDFDTAVGRRRHRRQQCLVGDEVGARDGYALSGVLNEGQHHSQVRLGGVAGAGGDELHGVDDGVGPPRLGRGRADGRGVLQHLGHGP